MKYTYIGQYGFTLIQFCKETASYTVLLSSLYSFLVLFFCSFWVHPGFLPVVIHVFLFLFLHSYTQNKKYHQLHFMIRQQYCQISVFIIPDVYYSFLNDFTKCRPLLILSIAIIFIYEWRCILDISVFQYNIHHGIFSQYHHSRRHHLYRKIALGMVSIIHIDSTTFSIPKCSRSTSVQ